MVNNTHLHFIFLTNARTSINQNKTTEAAALKAANRIRTDMVTVVLSKSTLINICTLEIGG